jgi:hypothetical protein
VSVVGRVLSTMNKDLSLLITYCILSTTSYEQGFNCVEHLLYTTQYTAGDELYTTQYAVDAGLYAHSTQYTGATHWMMMLSPECCKSII